MQNTLLNFHDSVFFLLFVLFFLEEISILK